MIVRKGRVQSWTRQRTTRLALSFGTLRTAFSATEKEFASGYHQKSYISNGAVRGSKLRQLPPDTPGKRPLRNGFTIKSSRRHPEHRHSAGKTGYTPENLANSLGAGVCGRNRTCSRSDHVDRHSASVPRVPRVTDFSQFNIMGVALSTRTTRSATTRVKRI
jgi:hypothetical protein